VGQLLKIADAIVEQSRIQLRTFLNGKEANDEMYFQC
jgi:hypothetical protein